MLPSLHQFVSGGLALASDSAQPHSHGPLGDMIGKVVGGALIVVIAGIVFAFLKKDKDAD